jgi:hypothetical protein
MRSIAYIFWALTLTCVTMPGQAQTRYTCSNNGRTYQSTQPCPGGSGSGGGMVNANTVKSQPAYEPRTGTASLGQAPAALKYMNPRCASLNDAIRTASARGLKYDTIAQMQREYSSMCSDDENEARARVSLDRSDQKRELKESAAQAKIEKERSDIHKQECGETKRFLYAKRAKIDMTDGEKSDLKRFEENYRSRCG